MKINTGWERMLAIAINSLGALVTLGLLISFQPIWYALTLILFALSVSATQCKRLLPITLPIFFLNVLFVIATLAYAGWLLFLAMGNSHLEFADLMVPFAVLFYLLVGIVNIIVIRRLHYS